MSSGPQGNLKKGEVEEAHEDFDEEDQHEKRQKEWGEQFHIWLIRAAKKERLVEITLSHPVKGVTDAKNIFEGIPKRIDKAFSQFVLKDGTEPWINTNFVVSCKPITVPEKTETAAKK